MEVSEFMALDHQQSETVFEWLPSDQGPEVSPQHYAREKVA